MTSRLNSVLSELDLPVAELSSARLNGEVFALGDFWCPVDEIDDAPRRAKAAGLLVPERAIAERITAAWIYGLVPEPARHQFCVDVGARVHLNPSPRLTVREVICPSEDTVWIGGQRVTRPLRTAIDLARWPTTDRDLAPLIARLLLLAGPDGADQARQLCTRPYLPFRILALERLKEARALLPIPVR